MDEPTCPEWWPQMLWKLHFPRPRPGPGPGPGPGPINFPPAIDDIMAGLLIHSLTYMLLDKNVAQDIRNQSEKTLMHTAQQLTKLHAASLEVEKQGG